MSAARSFPAGTCVAISLFEMRMIDAITIYLAAGAPFGVSYFLRKHERMGRARIWLNATGAALLWPLAAATTMLARSRSKHQPGEEDSDVAFDAQGEAKIEQAKRQLLAALHRVGELARLVSDDEGRKIEQATLVVRDSVEKYTGLTTGASGISADAEPDRSEMELCRIAGRAGDDLLLAGRCIHRRNVARLVAHRERSRSNLLHALASLREWARDDNAQRNPASARHLSVSVLKLYGHAINLLSLLEDEEAVRQVARLLDAECARLRRLEALGEGRTPEQKRATGEEQCNPHTPHLAFIGPSPTRTLTRG